MMIPYLTLDDTITAISTAPGVGAIGVVRLSGRDAVSVASRIFKGKNLSRQKSHTVHFGKIIDLEGREVDEVVTTIFHHPNSYTGEDVIEISAHGSPYILTRILELCIEAGARAALPGEFTQRAFLNGKMDLAQAEAVADLIAAESAAAHHTALNQLRGGFSRDLDDLRTKLVEFASLIELDLDFSEEDVEFADRKQFLVLIDTLKEKTSSLLESFRLGNVIKKGISVAIIGKPNAGKSTLLNALLNEERAIVSDIAGTTRDTIEETLNINGILFRLIDTAGIREHTTDIIESIGMERSRNNATQSDIILYLVDMNSLVSFDDRQNLYDEFQWLKEFSSKTIPVYTKYLLWQENISTDSSIESADSPYILTDAKSGLGIDSLKQVIFEKAVGGKINTDQTIITNVRHRDILQKISVSLDKIKTGLNESLSGDLLAIEIHECLRYIGELTGRVDIDRDILGTIFSKFCIGK